MQQQQVDSQTLIDQLIYVIELIAKQPERIDRHDHNRRLVLPQRQRAGPDRIIDPGRQPSAVIAGNPIRIECAVLVFVFVGLPSS